MHGIYKLVKDGNIVYIGKSDSSILSRIMAHTEEEKFADYFGSKIFYFEVKNSTETAIYEKLLINKYKPVLNVTDVHDESIDIPFVEPEWKPFNIEEETEREKREKAEKKERSQYERKVLEESFPRMKRVTFALSISEKDLQKLRVAAAIEGRTVAGVVHSWIETLPDEYAEMKIQ